VVGGRVLLLHGGREAVPAGPVQRPLVEHVEELVALLGAEV